MKFEIDIKNSFINLDATFDCGQVFRWEKGVAETWFGVIYRNLISIKKNGDKLTIYLSGDSQENINIKDIKNYLSINDNLNEIFSDIFSNIRRNKEKIFEKVLYDSYKKYFGLRILNTEPFETAISYILSRNNNIFSISKIIYNISKYLRNIDMLNLKNYTNNYDNGKINYPFPEPWDFMDKKFIDFCMNCSVKLRYPENQKKEIIEFSKNICNNKNYFVKLKNNNRSEPWNIEKLYSTREKLLQNKGIGNKVCDCIMLFGLNHLNAFPIDRWVLRFIEKYTLNSKIKNLSAKCIAKRNISDKEYLIFLEYANNIFGKYCGYAGEYLFYNEREKV